ERHGAVADCRHLSHPENFVSPRLYADRADYPDVSVDRFSFTARGRALYRSPTQTIFLAGRHDVYVGWFSSTVAGIQFHHASRGSRVGGRWFFGFPPRVVSRSPDGVRRAVWSGAIHFSGRGQRGWRFGSVIGG